MQIFLDTADIAHIERWKGIVGGVTTNPSIFKKCYRESGPNKTSVLQNVIEASSPLPVSVEVATDDPEGILEQAIAISELGKNVVVKIPIVTRDGKSCLPVITRLAAIASPPIKVNVTACMTAIQVFLAAKANPTYISLFAGRMQDESLEPFGENGVIERSYRLLREMPHSLRLIVGSIRTVRDAALAIESMADIVTITPEILEKLCDNSASRKVVAQFLEDAR